MSDVHVTPPEITSRLAYISYGQPWFDPCPHPRPEGCDGLDRAVPWPKQHTFVNPPFSNIGPWVDRVLEEYRNRPITVVLVPVRTSQPYWAKLVRHAEKVAYWMGDVDRGGKLSRRVRFIDAAGKRQAGAPFDTALFAIQGEGLGWSEMALFDTFADVACVQARWTSS